MRFVGWLIVIACTLAIVPSAHADEAADREEARREFTAGQAADRRRDWQAAIEHYLRANDLVPHPNAMFNIATDYERLGKLREAAVWYQRYVDAAQDSPDRDKVIRSLRDLAAKPGTLTVRSTPNGARVLVDNKFAGVTPYSGHITGGAHRVTIEYEGQREQREVKVEFGEPAILDVALRGASGTLNVIGEPQGALVTVDGLPAGSLPLTLNLAPGVHTVRVTQYGYAPYDTKASITPNQETVVDSRLARATGTLGSAPPTIHLGYLFGAGGGVDARGEGGLFLVELGIRASQFDATARVGKTIGLTAVDLLVRWTITKTRLAPFFSFGYSFVSRGDSESGSSSEPAGGYMLTGGLRFDVARGEHYIWSLIAESGLRAYTGLSDPGDSTTSESGLIVPIMTSLQLTYK